MSYTNCVLFNYRRLFSLGECLYMCVCVLLKLDLSVWRIKLLALTRLDFILTISYHVINVESNQKKHCTETVLLTSTILRLIGDKEFIL